MPSTDEPKRNRHGLLWLVVFLAVLFGLYSAGWFYAAGRIRSEANHAVAALNDRGIDAACANLQVSGYPLRLAVTCDSLAYEDDARNVAASTGSLSAVMQVYRPLVAVADVDGPLRTTAPGMAPLWLDWDHLKAAVGLSWPASSGVSIDAEGLSGQTDPADDSEPVQLFSAANAAAELRPNGRDLNYSGRFGSLEIDPGAIGGRVLPPLDGSAEATFRNGAALLAAPPKSLRGQSVEIGKLDLSSGEAHVSVSGPISIDAEGLVDASLAIRLENPKAVAAILAAAIPEKADQIRQGFAALALFGDKPSMPLRIVKGKASLGFIPLGRIEAVE
jgi:hypothetical protein